MNISYVCLDVILLQGAVYCNPFARAVGGSREQEGVVLAAGNPVLLDALCQHFTRRPATTPSASTNKHCSTYIALVYFNTF